ncbi:MULTISPECIES: RluA family pseudouridine synthase [Staphylococcus]|uniref:Pseudouridine synthase n=1 Tax=Staphylococcus epidermidis (strain ATCC 35984 / DSM 28319 / BCRC 17069 / CCUG 31568 / BM 3577 / RP62A) TaxID=176279 RepID=Q5HPZ4_STAEQ|nr:MULTISPECIES: RluA family pseudouridine synthase [Staphylococcus]MBX5334402.1 RluA family pseudouridine synthase [Rhodococcus fascians]MEB2859319.1 RluA family pseudouridine synthase [Staphylococcus sp. GCP4]SLD06029.1 pseudouridine synthase [Mycobacteroides abscessus subsp. massiliense]AAW54158.1 ribosomal large subunit pseudouridine synthase, RluD subfamily [Staphylococcus epidermidis RP62A]ASJ93721.1 RluA family pseudouridine synthase [Staphylococcus epidermidis]
MGNYNFNIIEQSQVGQRIDKLVSDLNKDWSRSQLQDWIKEGLVKVNGKVIKSNYKVKLNDKIVVTEKEVVEADIKPENLNLDIYYEDEDVAIVYKPKGMVVHPSPGHYSGTLVNGLMYQIKDLSGINGEIRPGIVHRIDKDTSGLLMVAKNDVAHRHLVEQLMSKTVKRKYTALVHGNIPHDYGTIDAPIGRNKNDRQAMAVVDDGKEAVTHFNVLEHFKDYTLIECQLETGRTHQIRVHMKYIGYPLVGDPKYGPKKTLDIGGQALHAGIIGFEHPVTHKYIEKHATLPNDFEKLLDDIRRRDA